MTEGGERMHLWKIYFTGDIHGSEECFRKFLRAGEFYGVETLVLAGDLVGKGMVPIIRESAGYRVENANESRFFSSSDELNAYMAMVGEAGLYPCVVGQDEYRDLCQSSEAREARLRELILQRLERWMSILEDSSSRKGYTYYISPGNDDPMFIDPLLEAGQRVRAPEAKVIWVHDQIEMLTCGCTNPTPWDTEREFPEDELFAMIDGLAMGVQDASRALFVLHAPPSLTKIDLAPELTDDLKIKGGLGGPRLAHVGSSAVRAIIEKYQPMAGVHGHIHEARGIDRIGRTPCINPGSEYAQGMLRGLILSLEVGTNVRFLNYLLVSG
jgi:Icc-related predicted phosphoesterase